MEKNGSFLRVCVEFLEKIEKLQAKNFEKAGKAMGDCIMADHLVHVVGTGGHTHLPAYDMFYRAGGLAAVSFVPALGALYGPVQATYGMRIERTPGYMTQVIDYFRVGKGDVAIVWNNIGVNAATIDSCLACKEKGAYTIGVAGSPWMDQIPKDHFTRHPSRKDLRDVVDLFIDDYNPVGDSVMEIDGFDRPFAPISGVTDMYIARRLDIEAIKYMVKKGFKPPVYMSANRIGGDEANAALIEKYFNRIKLL
jgi:uncharacterized phosphosugar-binding protein